MAEKYNGWLIVEKELGNYEPHGLVELPCILETKNKVIVLENETDYLSKCNELGIEIESE